ncbi:LamG-like jellyroll fold domain-containing protein [Psychrobacter sp. ER1]|uniref:LamG-like jellyroll fold domain-containing protein n=1 Tax=Psychrobacter sp. ER1 TaxID=3406645 RepID=UPI003B4317DD
MADNKITGRAKKYDGTPIDYVSIFNWTDGKCIAQVLPNAAGEWEYQYSTGLNVGLTYVANGCEPITHGAYQFDYVSAIPTDTILHYSFNGDALDQSASALNGVKTGVANFIAGRKAGTQCLEFINGCIRTPQPLVINSDKVAISFYMATNQNDLGVLFEMGQATGNNRFAAFMNNRSFAPLTFVLVDNPSTVSGSYAAINKSLVWQHIVLQADKSKPLNSEIEIYINNEYLAIRDNQLPSNVTGLFASHVLYIGQREASSLPFKGLIQDLRIYNRTLSAEERLALFNE